MCRYVMVLVTVLLLVPSTASAFTSAITEPAEGTRLVFDSSFAPLVHFAGTADSGPVDLKCVASVANTLGIGTTPIANNVPVDGGTHTFSTDASWPSNGGVCEVFAVPAGTIPQFNSDLNGLGGAEVYSAISAARSFGGKAYDYDVDISAGKAYDQVESLGDCPVEYQQLLNRHEYDGTTVACGAYLPSQDPTSSTPLDSLRIDSRPAYATATIGFDTGLRGLGGWTPVTYSVTDDSGTFHVVSHEDTYHCSGGTSPDSFPPSGSECGGFASTGVGVTLDDRVPGDGRTIVQNIKLTSTDHQAHTVQAVLNHETNDVREWFFPGTAGFQGYGTGTSPSVVAAGPATIRDRIAGGADPDITKAYGGTTYVRQPASTPFTSAGDDFAQAYAPITIPADGTVRFAFIYTADKGTAGLASLIAAAEASIGAPPSVTVTSPATATAPAYTLTGTVTAPENLSTFAINGQNVAVAGDGSFSAPETLAAGANAFTLTGTDELGQTTTTPFSVNLTTTGPPSGAVAAVVFRTSGKPKLKGRTLTTGVTAGCPGAGPDCSIAAVASAGHKKAATGRATVKAGATAKLTLTLTKQAAKLLKRKHKLKLSLKLTGRRTGAATTTAKRTIKLKLRT